MMGRLKREQEQLFYSFCLDEAVPDDHTVRAIAAVLDLSWVHGRACILLLTARPLNGQKRWALRCQLSG